MEADIDADGHSLVNLDDISAADDHSSWSSSGSGNGNLQLWDSTQGKPLVRAREGGELLLDADTKLIGGLSVADWKVVDVVEAGGDPTGGESINPVLEDEFADNVVFVFPQGTYYMDARFEKTGFENVAFVGQPRATIRVDEPYEQLSRLFILGSSTDNTDPSYENSVTFRNLTFDIDNGSSQNPGCPLIIARPTNRLVIDGVRIEGEMQFADGSYDGNDGYATVNPWVTGEGGHGYVSIVARDGGKYDPDTGSTNHPVGIGVQSESKGILHFYGCDIRGFPNNGLYIKGGERAVIERCFAANNQVANIRTGQNMSIRDCHVRVDGNVNSDFGKTNGIRIDEGNTIVERTKVEMLDGDGAAVKQLFKDDGEVTVRNVDITLDVGTIRALDITGADATDESVYDNVRIKGSGSDTYNYAVKVTRPYVTFRNCHVNVPDMRGITLQAPYCTINGGYLTSNQYRALGGSGSAPDGDRLTVRDLRLGGSLHVPSDWENVTLADIRLDGGSVDVDASDTVERNVR
ncbi:hypothetical protein GCM10009000_048210 [Halobacterium noricense]|uniref:Right handed beta helix domain-containing protein n=3 Tax=Haladaptatus pallidirubidus TaxID=1008152 RepID=A0AAV3UEI4_9EURY